MGECDEIKGVFVVSVCVLSERYAVYNKRANVMTIICNDKFPY